MINTTHLRTLRVDRGYSIRALAKAAGVEHQTIRRLENGADTGDLPLRVLDRIATALGVHPTTLFGDPDPGHAAEATEATEAADAAEQHHLQQRIGGTILAAPGISITNLAVALHTTIQEVEAALPALGRSLAEAGLTLTRNGDTLRITPRELHSTTAADTRPMTLNEARLLRRIHRGQDVRRSLAKVDRDLTLPSLTRRGLVDVAAPVPTPAHHLCRAPQR